MCGLFGFLNYSGKEIKDLSKLTNSLAEEASIRGTDATGIAYIGEDGFVVNKAPKSAYCVEFKHSDDVKAVIGHTRHTTQGNAKKNYNNHPFMGHCSNTDFCFAHNGVLFNDEELRKKHHLKKTKIETDSFVTVQMLEQKKIFNAKHLKEALEQLEGSFAFSLLDDKNSLWLIRGDNPISIIHLKNLKLYIYASTEQILYKALVGTKLFEEIKNGGFEEIKIQEGDILNILPNGTIIYDKFNYIDYSYFPRARWWEYDTDNTYIDDLKAVARSFGYEAEMIDDLIDDGFMPEEIEDFMYCYE